MTPKRMTKEEFFARWLKDQEEKQVEAKRRADAEYAAYVRQCVNKRKYKWRKINNE